MIEETVVAAPSAAQETPAVIEVDRGALVTWTPEQRTEFRTSGKMPEPPKTEATATSSEAEKAETRAASEADPTKQEKPKAEQPKAKTAEERIAQLESTIEKIRKGAGLEKTQKAESSPARVEPQPQPKPQPQYTRPKPASDDKSPDGSAKYNTYEDFVEELADWKAEQRLAEAERTRAAQAQAQELEAKVAEARGRYENFDGILTPTLNAIVSDPSVSPSVKAMLNDSEVLPDLIFTIGSSQEELASFVKMAQTNPGKALRYIALTESLIHEELAGKAKPKAEAKGTPVKPQTSAPPPPAEVGGRASAPPDALESAAQTGDYRAFKAEANRRAIARLKG